MTIIKIAERRGTFFIGHSFIAIDIQPSFPELVDHDRRFSPARVHRTYFAGRPCNSCDAYAERFSPTPKVFPLHLTLPQLLNLQAQGPRVMIVNDDERFTY